MLKTLCDKFCKKPRQARKDIVIVLPYDAQNKKILLIKEYRKQYNKEIWKFVSGGMDKPHLNPLQTAQEELAEEIKREAKEWSLFHQFDKLFSPVNIYYYVAHNPNLMAEPIENPDEEDIILDEKWVNLDKLWQMVDDKELIWKESVLVAINFLRAQEKD
ncbi:MAG: NTP pyrophosphohydrolase [uncultured Sulfurovum sp.]|uniref:NTP pyrophosphohydrolase n=1 Tax=uncultured Sulfurovum sp. TaxID=269237 RepID=A0A6S6UF22_9BACT|nr:MAG: NTP pyrophosphohydrolase [uncultured Sulfurovum sp.]